MHVPAHAKVGPVTRWVQHNPGWLLLGFVASAVLADFLVTPASWLYWLSVLLVVGLTFWCLRVWNRHAARPCRECQPPPDDGYAKAERHVRALRAHHLRKGNLLLDELERGMAKEWMRGLVFFAVLAGLLGLLIGGLVVIFYSDSTPFEVALGIIGISLIALVGYTSLQHARYQYWCPWCEEGSEIYDELPGRVA